MKSNILIFFRWSPHNWYSWAPLVPALQKQDLKNVYSLKKLDILEIESKIKNYKIVFYLDSFHSLFFWENHSNLSNELSELRKITSMNKIKFISIVGGSHATGDALSCLKTGFNYVLRGEGEYSLPLLIKTIITTGNLDNVGNLSYLDKNGEEIRNSKAPLIILDEYSSYSENPGMHPPIEIMRGCSFRCRFCQTPYLFGGQVRFRSLSIVEKIVDHYIDFFSNRNSIDIRFIAPNFLGYLSKDGKKSNIEALISLRKMLQKKNVRMFLGTFPSEIRPEFVDEEVISEVLAYSDSNKIAIGLQSGSNTLLSKVKRGHTVEIALNAIELLLKHNMEPHVDFIIGLPGETREEQFETLELIKQLTKKACKIRMHYFIPLLKR